MLNSESKQAVIEFLQRYPRPALKTSETMLEGYVACLDPVPTIFGPELMCNPANAEELRNLMEGRG